MKRVLLIFLLLSLTISVSAKGSDIEFKVPENFRVDTISENYYIVKSDSAIAYIDFYEIPNIDKKKAKATPDSAFLNIPTFKQIESDLKGNADVITKYYVPEQGKYAKIYRFVHGDGITTILAFNNVDDFAWADTLDQSYHKGLRWYSIALFIIGGIIMCIASIGIAAYFKINWPRFIVCVIVNLAILITAYILGMGELSLMLMLLFLIVGIAQRHGYTIIPI